MFAGIFEAPAVLLSWFYQFTHSYTAAITLIAAVVMLLITPLTLKSTKGMLEMQRLAPEMRRLQNEHRSDRQKLNEEMMKLYQEHKVNPLSSCLPLLAQMPVFIVMFRILHGLTYRPGGDKEVFAHAVYSGAVGARPEVGFLPRYVSHDSELFQSLVGKTEMKSFGLDLAKSAIQAVSDSPGTGMIYVLIVAILGVLYFVQQRMVAARASISPTMSPTQQKLMQYLPVVFAVFQVVFLLGLVIYYIAQAILRIIQQAYITRKFYGNDESLGRQAQRAGEQARELAAAGSGAKDGEKVGILAQARRDFASARGEAETKSRAKAGGAKQPAASANNSRPSKRTTAPKNRPTPSGRSSRPGGQTNRPTGTRNGRSGGSKRR